MRDQRRVSNLFVKSNLIAKYGRLVLIAWGITLSISVVGHWYLSHSLTAQVLPEVQPAAQGPVEAHFQRFLIQSLVVNILTFTALIWSILAFLTLMNHRVYGPIEVLKDFIGHLKSGNYDPPKRSLRETDELKPLMEELNHLADALKNKKS